MTRNGFAFSTVPRLHVGAGVASKLPTVLQELGMARPLLVSDPGIAAAGLLDGVVDALANAGRPPSLFTGVAADPPTACVEAAVAHGRAAACDGVVGLGGGSAMDVAKLAAVLLPGTQALADMLGVGKVRVGRLPLVQVPTTAGTGSEVTPIAIVTLPEGQKAGVVSPVLLADAALLDAALTMGLPPAVTAATGIDAMVHAIEAFTSRLAKNPLSDMAARQALRLLGPALPAALADGTDLDARQDMLVGAMLAGQAFANAPVGAIHALAYPLGTRFHLPHGLCNALVMPAVMRFNLSAAAEAYAELADLFGLAAGAPAAERAAALIDHMRNLVARCGLPTTLRQAGVPAEALPRMAAEAMLQTRLLVNNPRPMDEPDALALYREAYGA